MIINMILIFINVIRFAIIDKGHLLAGRNVVFASGLSFQNQLMVLGGERTGNPFA